MKTTAKTPQSEVEKLRALVIKQEQTINQLRQENFSLFEQLRLARVKRFAASSEKGDNPQLPLFNEAEDTIDNLTKQEREELAAEEETCVVKTHKRKSKARRLLPEDLPREEIIIDLTDEEKQCDVCGHTLHKMGEYRVEKLEPFV